MRRMPTPQGQTGPRGYASVWPEILRDYADAVASEENRDKANWHDSFYRRPKATASAISRMEAVFDWHRYHLSGKPELMRPLWMYACSKAYGFLFKRACKARGWNRTTAYRRMRAALDYMATCLNVTCEPWDAGEWEEQ